MHSIAQVIGRSVSTVSRELKRNRTAQSEYSAVEAQRKYEKRREKCKRHKLLEDTGFLKTVGRLFLENQWSPKEIAKRFAYEKSPYQISYNTI